MPRYLGFIFLLLLSLTTTAQSFQKIKSLLRQGDFQGFKTYIDSAYKAKDTSATWELLRTVVSDYQEGVVGIHEMGSLGSPTSPKLYFLYSLHVIASKEKIIFYELKRKNLNTQPDATFETEESFRNDKAYTAFEASFRNVYHVPIELNDLFQTSIVYGDHCGIAGTNPSYLQELNINVKARKISEINKWLKSANAEKQLYAVRGYRWLTSQGYELTDEEKEILTIVQQKDVAVNVCRGCSFGNEEFRSIISEIETSPISEIEPGITEESTYRVARSPRNYSVTILGMALLFFISVYNIAKYIRLRGK